MNPFNWKDTPRQTQDDPKLKCKPGRPISLSPPPEPPTLAESRAKGVLRGMAARPRTQKDDK